MIFPSCIFYVKYVKASSKFVFKDTQREKAPSNKTAALTKSTNMSIWVVGTSNEFFTRGS